MLNNKLNNSYPWKEVRQLEFLFVYLFSSASYAGIAKLKSATGQTVAPVPPVQPPAAVRPAPTKPSAPPARPATANQQQQQQQQQQRGNGNNYQQNSRGNNNQWNENNSQQDQSPARRSGQSVTNAPNEQQVFVGSLPLEFTREDLIDCFKQFGQVLDAKIHQPNYDNKKVRSIDFRPKTTLSHVSFLEFWFRSFRQG